MSLLQQIQEAVVNEKSDLSSILLKLRLLATKLGSDILDEWVKYESEGYPKEIEVPCYRDVNISYIGTFTGGSRRYIDVAIPPFVIEKFVGKHIDGDLMKYKVRLNIAAVEKYIKQSEKGKKIAYDASNLVPFIEKKIYSRCACNGISIVIDSAELCGITQIVRNRIVELTSKIEISAPGAIKVDFRPSIPNKKETERVQLISQQIIYGNVNNAVVGSGHVSVVITEGDDKSFVKYLVKSGISESDASELAKIMETENPKSADEPFGKKAQEWFTNNIKKAGNGTWKIGVSVASKVLTEAAIKFYGL